MKKILNHKLLRLIIIIAIIALILFLAVYLILKFYPPLGGTPSKEDKENYASRATNYKDGKFYNLTDYKIIYKKTESNKYKSKKETVPKDKIPTIKPSFIEKTKIDTLNITWLGHSSLFMQMHGMNILVDPVFSEYASPISFVGPSRFSELPVDTNDLPNIDIVIITHDHYDHLDYNTIKEIDKKVDKYIVPLGIENHLEKWGVDKDKIINMAWWEEVNIDGLTIGCTPAKHYSRRSLNDGYNTLWSSWVFIDEYHKVFESGDTGFDKHFKEIYNRYGEFDLSLLDSGQYDKRWKDTHMTPEESVEAGKILNSKVIMPIHWGTFRLANHPWDDSAERFTIAADKKSIKYITPRIGKTVTYEKNMNTDKWWTNIE